MFFVVNRLTYHLKDFINMINLTQSCRPEILTILVICHDDQIM